MHVCMSVRICVDLPRIHVCMCVYIYICMYILIFIYVLPISPEPVNQALNSREKRPVATEHQSA